MTTIIRLSCPSGNKMKLKKKMGTIYIRRKYALYFACLHREELPELQM
jgi:hypothetical protein